MIGLLSGLVRHKKTPHLIIECGGVGYEIEVTIGAFSQSPDVGKTMTVYTHLLIRDDAHVLFGFADLEERDLFRTLIKVSGVGPKIGVAILSGMNATEVVEVIATKNSEALTKISGIGKKMAERIIVELKDKFKDLSNYPHSNNIDLSNDIIKEAIEGLTVLGFKIQAAENMIKNVYQKNSDSATLIRQALKIEMKNKR